VAGGYTHKNVLEAADAAERFGFAETHESRFPSKDLETEQTGFAFHRFKPGKRQPFGHMHNDAEEVYFVVSGSGRMKLDDDVIELEPLDAVRVSAGVMRAFDAGADGLDILAFGPRRADDRGDVVQDWWSD